jgi:DNA-binding NarL/FixJ family response regulator
VLCRAVRPSRPRHPANPHPASDKRRTVHVRRVAGRSELTSREREITTLVGVGLSNEEIAGQLFISPATAKTHVNRPVTKVGARDRAQLVVFAYETGLVAPRRT